MLTEKKDKPYISGMPKSPDTARHEVHLHPDVIKDLRKIAEDQNRSLKNLMEHVLINFAKENKKVKKG
jgi:hypothetical protein